MEKCVKLFILLVLLSISNISYAASAKVEVSATVVNAADITDGVVTGPEPVQIDYDDNGNMLVSY